MKRLYLTGLKRVLTEEAQKRLEEFEDQDDSIEPRDENGRTAQWYEDLNLPTPPELLRKPSDYIEFDLEEDYEEYLLDVVIRLDQFVMAVENEDEETTIYLKNGNNVTVTQNSAEIDAQIDWLTRPWYKKLIK